MFKIKVQIEAEVNPTESEEKIEKAIWNLFGELSTETKPAQKGSTLTAEYTGQEPLITFRNLLHRDHIRDASRRALYHGLKAGILTVYLNKQAAFAGHVSFTEPEGESPLGPIKVTVEAEDPVQLIDWMAPRTTKSRE
jgi:predicted RNA binding protein with dsRBD fold (UPF0201 family)